MIISRRDVFSVWRSEKTLRMKCMAIEKHVLNTTLNNDSSNKNLCNKLKGISKRISYDINVKWRSTGRSLKGFNKKYGKWLDGSIQIFKTTGAGRPVKAFGTCLPSTQQKKITPLANQASSEELMGAARKSLYKEGKRNASSVISKLQSGTDEVANKIKKSFEPACKLPMKYTLEEALALYIDGRFTRHSYILMQGGGKKRNANIYPTYDVLVSAKSKCYPLGVEISNTSGEVPLQNLIDHTIMRIIESQKNLWETSNEKLLTAVYKWGCDGSSGHATYRQGYSEIDASCFDEHLFAICLVPLQILMEDSIVWQNPRPSSTRYCRPIKLMFQKETSSLISAEVKKINEEILKISPTTIGKLEIQHRFHLTMIDGKTFGVIAGSSSQICGICKASPKMMNDLHILKHRSSDENMYEYGLSTLHCWIRFFECILHIAYRIPIKKWQIRGADKDIANQTKSNIQEKLRMQMHLLVDVAKPGSGNTNTGNTARRFFENPYLASLITGVNEQLINNFSVILRTLACGYNINVEKFREYTMHTAAMFIELYPWFYMPNSVHKVLLHGADVIEKMAVPIGLLSEEALEARNKDFRYIRQHHTRKTSRQKTMQDLMNQLFVSSDPFISFLSGSTAKCSKNNIAIDDEVLNLLQEKELDVLTDSVSSDSE